MFDKNILKTILSNEIVSISFKKANGKDRKIVCRIPTNQKFFSGGELKGNRDHLLEVIDLTLLKKNKDNNDGIVPEGHVLRKGRRGQQPRRRRRVRRARVRAGLRVHPGADR